MFLIMGHLAIHPNLKEQHMLHTCTLTPLVVITNLLYPYHSSDADDFDPYNYARHKWNFEIFVANKKPILLYICWTMK